MAIRDGRISNAPIRIRSDFRRRMSESGIRQEINIHPSLIAIHPSRLSFRVLSLKQTKTIIILLH